MEYCRLVLYSHILRFLTCIQSSADSNLTMATEIAIPDKLFAINFLRGKQRKTASAISSPGGAKANWTYPLGQGTRNCHHRHRRCRNHNYHCEGVFKRRSAGQIRPAKRCEMAREYTETINTFLSHSLATKHFNMCCFQLFCFLLLTRYTSHFVTKQILYRSDLRTTFMKICPFIIRLS